MSPDQIVLAREYLADPGSNAVQSVSIQYATGGTFTLTFNGQTTTALAYNAGGNDVQNALAALSNIGLGNILVNLQPIASLAFFTEYVVYFAGTLGNLAQPMLTINGGSLTGSQTVLTNVALVLPGGVSAFTDTELSAFFDQADSNFFLSIAYAFRALWANASKFNDYVAGQSQEKKNQIFTNLLKIADYYQEWSQADRQVQFSSIQPEPPRLRAVPLLVGQTATGLTYAPPYSSSPFGNRRNPWGWG